MDDLKVLSETVLERAAALAEVRLKHVPYEAVAAGELNLQDFVRAVYLDGVRDGMGYLEHLLEEGGEA